MLHIHECQKVKEAITTLSDMWHKQKGLGVIISLLENAKFKQVHWLS